MADIDIRLAGLPLLQLILLLCGAALASPLKNITISVPDTATFIADQNTVCLPGSAADLLTFYLTNYVTHAASLKGQPGDSMTDTVFGIVAALICPTSGIIKALNAIFRCAIFSKDELQKAAKAGALCTVVRSATWQPRNGERVTGVRVLLKAKPAKSVNPPKSNETTASTELASATTTNADETPPESSNRPDTSSNASARTSGHSDAFTVKCNNAAWLEDVSWLWTFRDVRQSNLHGARKVYGAIENLSDEYNLAYLPRDVILEDLPGEDFRKANMSSSFGLTKAIIAVVQTVYAAITLYAVRGDQLNRYGYAAYGLTVAPYITMSIINLISHVLTPDYTDLYLVRSDAMVEAEARGAQFSGVCARLIELETPADRHTVTFVRENAGKKRWKVEGSADFKGCGESRDGPQIDVPSCGMFHRKKTAPTSKERFFPAFWKRKAETHPSIAWIRGQVLGIAKVSAPNLNRIDSAVGNSTFSILLIFLASSLPLIIVGTISRFRPGQSSIAQRVWTMSWLALSVVLGPFFDRMASIVKLYMFAENMIGGLPQTSIDANPRLKVFMKKKWYRYSFRTVRWTQLLVSLAALGTPAVGGLVVVGQMLAVDGNCVSLG